MERDDHWYRTRVSQLGIPLSAWFALECGGRVLPRTEDSAEAEGLWEVQRFLLGRSTWFELEEARQVVAGRLWATTRDKPIQRMALRVLLAAANPDSPTQHANAARFARRLDEKLIEPLTAGVREASLQEQRLELLLSYATNATILRLRKAFRQTGSLELLGLLADALQDEGFEPPLREQPK